MTRRFVIAGLTGVFGSCSRWNSAPPPKKFPLKGKVIKLNAGTRTALIQHENIPGFMDAMTMEFPVKSDTEWAKLREGADITATVCYVEAAVSYWIEDIQVK
ncbi:MAG: copper-binding protein [Bryobacterales bacterium]|nr:copper-binding protein [Bryobacterales bacterium]